MYKTEEPHINGKYLYYAFIAGGNAILQQQTEINRINIFPVNDKDTGTNLASTIRAGRLDHIPPERPAFLYLSIDHRINIGVGWSV